MQTLVKTKQNKILEKLKAVHSEAACQINFPWVVFDDPGEVL